MNRTSMQCFEFYSKKRGEELHLSENRSLKGRHMRSRRDTVDFMPGAYADIDVPVQFLLDFYNFVIITGCETLSRLILDEATTARYSKQIKYRIL